MDAPNPKLSSLLQRTEVIRLLDVSETTFWRLVKRGQFPAPITIGTSMKRWLQSDVEDYLQKRIDERDQ